MEKKKMYLFICVIGFCLVLAINMIIGTLILIFGYQDYYLQEFNLDIPTYSYLVSTICLLVGGIIKMVKISNNGTDLSKNNGFVKAIAIYDCFSIVYAIISCAWFSGTFKITENSGTERVVFLTVVRGNISLISAIIICFLYVIIDIYILYNSDALNVRKEEKNLKETNELNNDESKNIELIKKYKELYDMGAISEEEFAEKKKK